MQFEFFPSPTLARYIGKMFAVRIVAVLLMLVLILQMLDLLSESGKVLAAPGNGQGQLLTYVSLRAPQLVSRFLPYSVLLATIITLMTLNQNSEVVAMKAAGLSAHQVLAPLFLVAAATSIVTFAFNERVVTRSTSTLKAWQNVEYGPIPEESAIKSNIWLQDGPHILFARTIAGEGKAMRMTGVSWYRRDPTGMVTEIVTSPDASFANPGWTFRKPVMFDVQSARKTTSATDQVFAKSVEPIQVIISKVDADAESLTQLNGSIAAIREAGFRTTEIEGKWWHKLSGPLSALLMPLLGAYFVFDNAALAMGNFGAYPPFLAAWAPFVLFLLIGETVLIRTEE